MIKLLTLKAKHHLLVFMVLERILNLHESQATLGKKRSHGFLVNFYLIECGTQLQRIILYGHGLVICMEDFILGHFRFFNFVILFRF